MLQVICLDCGAQSDRSTLQHTLRALNPGFGAHESRQDSRESAQALLGRSNTWDGDGHDGRSAAPRPHAQERPDGDAELGDDAHLTFRYPGCDQCGGMLKPDVVFFGENIPRCSNFDIVLDHFPRSFLKLADTLHALCAVICLVPMLIVG